jgi:thioredoxin-related protein
MGRFYRQLAILGLALLAVSPVRAALSGWHDDLGAARNAARENGSALIVMFVQEGCPECERMERNASSQRVRSALSGVSKVILEYSDNRSIASRYRIDATPTIMLFTPEGNYSDCIYRYEGALSASSLVALGKRAVSAAKPVPESAGNEKAYAGAAPASETRTSVRASSSMTRKPARTRRFWRRDSTPTAEYNSLREEQPDPLRLRSNPYMGY